jgi:hypothetical protein
MERHMEEKDYRIAMGMVGKNESTTSISMPLTVFLL